MDLFPVAVEPPPPEHVAPYEGTLASSAQPTFSSTSPSSSSSSTHSPTIQQHYHQPHSSPPDYRFVSDTKTPSASSSSGSKTLASHYSGYILPSHSPSDVVHRFGNYPITESSKQTQALVGATFVQPALVDYQGTRSIVFVFAVRFSYSRSVSLQPSSLLTNRYSLGFSRKDWRHVHLTLQSLWHFFKTIQSHQRSGNHCWMLWGHVPCLFHQGVSGTASIDWANQGKCLYIFSHRLKFIFSTLKASCSMGSSS